MEYAGKLVERHGAEFRGQQCDVRRAGGAEYSDALRRDDDGAYRVSGHGKLHAVGNRPAHATDGCGRSVGHQGRRGRLAHDQCADYSGLGFGEVRRGHDHHSGGNPGCEVGERQRRHAEVWLGQWLHWRDVGRQRSDARFERHEPEPRCTERRGHAGKRRRWIECGDGGCGRVFRRNRLGCGGDEEFQRRADALGLQCFGWRDDSERGHFEAPDRRDATAHG